MISVPNALTFLRFLGIPLFIHLTLNLEADGWAIVVLAIGGATDYFDGKIARAWNQTSRFGELADPAIDRHLDQVEWAQRVNIAAKTGWHRDRLAPALRTALDSWERRVPTAKLNSFLGALIGATPPPVRGGKQPKVYYATQAGIAPPKFVVFSSGWIEASYRRFIERRLREEFKFPGTPVQVAVRVKERDKE